MREKRLFKFLLVLSLCLPFVVEAKNTLGEFNRYEFAADTLVSHHQKEIDFIKEFYYHYMKAFDNGDVQYVLHNYVTPPFIDKQQRMGWVTENDPFLRTKDLDINLLSTVKVRPLGGKWFEISYGKSDSICSIPLRLISWGKHFQVDFVTPERDGDSYGDSLLYECPDPVVMSQKSALDFVRTFYENYGRIYAGIFERPQRELQRFRLMFCTTDMLEQFASVEREYRRDGHQMFDVLISDYDFDRSQLKDLKFEDLKNNQIQVSLGSNTVSLNLIVNVVKQNGNYKIDGVSLRN